MTKQISIVTSTLTRADGSAEWKFASTHMICSASGPMEVKPRDEVPERATIELVVRPIIGMQTTRESLIESRIYSVISASLLRHLHPRSLFQIVIQTLELGEPHDTTVLEIAAGVNSSTVALLDAGAPLRSVVTAVAAVVTNSNHIIWQPDLDFFESHGHEITSTHAVAYDMVADEDPKLLLCESTGDFTEKEVLNIIDLAVEQCEPVYKAIRLSMQDKIAKDFIWRK